MQGASKMSSRCPNCHAEMTTNKCPSCHMTWKTKPDWVCPDCGTEYYCVGQMRFCPACQVEKDKVEKDYWDNKRSGLRSVSDNIVARTLAGNK